MSLIKAEVELIQVIVFYLHDEGRLTMYKTLKAHIDNHFSWLVDRFKFSRKPYNLIAHIRRQPNLFYEFTVSEIIYIALSRDHFHLFPRVAMVIAPARDPVLEKLITKNQTKKFSNVKKFLKNAKAFGEYEFAKCALGFLEILRSIQMILSVNNPIPISLISCKYEEFSALGKCIMDMFSNEKKEIKLLKFISEFRCTFSFDHVTIGADLKNLQALILASEMDLIWSYAGICLTKGVMNIDVVTEEINTFIQKANLTLVTSFTSSETMEKILRCRYRMCLLPGDGSVWMIDPLFKITKEASAEIEEFYKLYLLEKEVYYKDLYKILKQQRPNLVASMGEFTYINIAAILYPLKHFLVENGIFKSALNRKPSINYIEVKPVEVPTEFVNDTKLSRWDIDNIEGYVRRVGLRSALLTVVGSYPQLKSTEELIVFCNCETTKVNGERVKDFTQYLAQGDSVIFDVRINETVSMEYPCFITAVLVKTGQVSRTLKVTTGVKETGRHCRGNVVSTPEKEIASDSDNSSESLHECPRLHEEIATRVPILGLHLKYLVRPDPPAKPNLRYKTFDERRTEKKMWRNAILEWESEFPAFSPGPESGCLVCATEPYDKFQPLLTALETPYYEYHLPYYHEPALVANGMLKPERNFVWTVYPNLKKEKAIPERAAEITGVYLQEVSEILCQQSSAYLSKNSWERSKTEYQRSMCEAMMAATNAFIPNEDLKWKFVRMFHFLYNCDENYFLKAKSKRIIPRESFVDQKLLKLEKKKQEAKRKKNSCRCFSIANQK